MVVNTGKIFNCSKKNKIQKCNVYYVEYFKKHVRGHIIFLLFNIILFITK